MQKILVVNSDQDLLALLKGWLEKRDYNVTYTRVEEDVVPILEQFDADLAIIDFAQKEVVHDIKHNSKTSGVPILLMTGYTLRGVPLNLEVDDTIEKPFNLELLEQKVEALLQKRPVES